jgi:hypothetical protein
MRFSLLKEKEKKLTELKDSMLAAIIQSVDLGDHRNGWQQNGNRSVNLCY